MTLTLFLCVVGLGLAAAGPGSLFPVNPTDPYVRYVLQTALDFEGVPQRVLSVERIVGRNDDFGIEYYVDFLDEGYYPERVALCFVRVFDPMDRHTRRQILEQRCMKYPPFGNNDVPAVAGRYTIDQRNVYVRNLLESVLATESPDEYVMGVWRIFGEDIQGTNYFIDYYSKEIGYDFYKQCHIGIYDPKTILEKPKVFEKECTAMDPVA